MLLAALAVASFCGPVMSHCFAFFCGIFVDFMSVGIMPVAGIPLPLLSYGGSNLVSTLWAVGIAESIYARRMALV